MADKHQFAGCGGGDDIDPAGECKFVEILGFAGPFAVHLACDHLHDRGGEKC